VERPYLGNEQRYDDILLDWYPKPTLNEVIAAQVQALARAISATTNRGQSLTEVKDGLDALAGEIHKTSIERGFKC
jgi:hypothetical protein